MIPNRHPPLQPGWSDQPHERLGFGDFALESGAVVADFSLSYVVHGRMAPARDNVVLALSAIGSTHHRMDAWIARPRARYGTLVHRRGRRHRQWPDHVAQHQRGAAPAGLPAVHDSRHGR